MKKAKHQLDLVGNPYFVDEKKNLVFDTEYDYAIYLAKRVLSRNRKSTTDLNFTRGRSGSPRRYAQPRPPAGRRTGFCADGATWPGCSGPPWG